jgi:mutator protein MutT
LINLYHTESTLTKQAISAILKAMGNDYGIDVVAAVIQRGNAFLVAQRPSHKRHGGLWEFPGGKVHAGESLLEAARRELAEELSVDVTDVGERLFSRRDPDSPFVILFVPVVINGTPRAIEHTNLCWATVAELKTLPLAPSDAQFVAEYLQHHF